VRTSTAVKHKVKPPMAAAVLVGVLQDQRHFGELVTATRAATIGHDQHDLTDKRLRLQPEGGQGL
jgi:hypothetical protein